ncbi:MAG TPA: RtcB family protein [Steroidobacteraceae bacterium]|nr:RtcB family protein [Steroidobacteraceae bacterium]
MSHGRVPAKIWTTDIDEATELQVLNLTTLPFIHKHVAVMPDCHVGIGSTVGTVIPTIKAIVPAAVGVDIGCGMMAHRLNLRADELPDSLGAVRSAIEAAIPHGRTDNGGRNDRGAWGEPPPVVEKVWDKLFADDRYFAFPKEILSRGQGSRQLGTLGTGNHFIELCTDTEGGVWLMLHSGSRGIGNKIGSYFIERAKEEMERWHIELPDPNLAYLPEGTDMFKAYWQALSWAQDYAMCNRQIMMGLAVDAVGKALGRELHSTEMAVNCHHNYVALEHHYGRNVYVTRKGAVRAREGDLGIIPGSMGARSFIVRGRGNPESFDSCSHGAGRKMSRGAAKAQFTVDDLYAQTAGVECRKDSGVIDEIPAAYKDIQQVMDNQSDLVEILYTLKQCVCVKG